MLSRLSILAHHVGRARAIPRHPLCDAPQLLDVACVRAWPAAALSPWAGKRSLSDLSQLTTHCQAEALSMCSRKTPPVLGAMQHLALVSHTQGCI
jgi:hypothetical protein